MKENTTDAYIHAFDESWDAFVDEWYRTTGRRKTPPSKWESYAAGFSAGVKYGRENPKP